MKRIKIDSVKPGDILFTARPGPRSKRIRFMTGGVVSHAMICVAHGSFIDSTLEGVQARNLQRELFEDDDQAFHFRLKNPPERQILAQLIDYARAEIGARYSILEAVISVSPIHGSSSKKQFCSRLVARAFKRAGIELVPDSDYCTPEDLRRSPLLECLTVEFEPVADQDLTWMDDGLNPVRAMHVAQNTVLEEARSIDPKVENFNDLYSLLLARPEADNAISDALESSGYLELWKNEVNRHPWRYTVGLIEKLSERPEFLRDYCIGTIKHAYTGGVHFAINLVQLKALQEQHPRRTFCRKIELYETLVRNDQSRREIAYDWLQRHHPDLLTQHMEEIEPHTLYWWSLIDRVEPRIAALSRHAVALGGSIEVCTSCADQPAASYRVVNGAEAMPGVPSLRLCDDCIGIRRGMGNILVPFLSGPRKHD